MPVLQRRGRREFSDDTLKSIQTFIVKRTAGMVSGGFRTDLRRNLTEDEQSELVALTREAEEGGGFVLDRLSKRKQEKWEALVGKGGGDPKFFSNYRATEEVKALAALAHRETARRPFSRREQATLFQALGDALVGGSMSATTLGTFVIILLALERGEGFAPHSRIERDPDGEPVLIVNRTYGLLRERQDWRASLAAWRQGCEQLARNSWIELDASAGNEMRVRLGSRAKRAMRGDLPRGRRTAA